MLHEDGEGAATLWFSLTEQILQAETAGDYKKVYLLESERLQYKETVETYMSSELSCDVNNMLDFNITASLRFKKTDSWFTASPRDHVEVIKWKSAGRRIPEAEKQELEKNYALEHDNENVLYICDTKGRGDKLIIMSDRLGSRPYVEFVLAHEVFHRYCREKDTPNWRVYSTNNDATTIQETSADIFGKHRAIEYTERKFGNESNEYAACKRVLSNEGKKESKTQEMISRYNDIAKDSVTAAEEYLEDTQTEIPELMLGDRIKPNAAYLAAYSCYSSNKDVTDKLEAIYEAAGPRGFAQKVGEMVTFADLDKTYEQLG